MFLDDKRREVPDMFSFSYSATRLS